MSESQDASLSTNMLEVEERGGTWTFTLNRPDKLNALNAQLVDDLLKAVEHANANQPKVLVFKGAGRSFCAGFDLSELEIQTEGDLVLRFIRIESLLQAVARSPAVTVALAHGKVFGAGVDLVAVCRHRICTSDATFRMPGLQFGLVLGTRRFGEIVGKEAARATLEGVSGFTSEAASEMRFIQSIAPQEEWDAVVDRAEALSRKLCDTARADLYDVLSLTQANDDLATLARSAARPGLKDRLRKYLAR